jgi:hypothetical protein
VRAGVRRSNKALLGRREGCAIAYLRAFQGRRGQMHGSAIDGLAVDEIVARGRCHGLWIMRIDEIKVVHIPRIQDIDVVDSRVPDVDVIDEPTAATEAGKERFPKP